jgi:hypothetical protein
VRALGFIALVCGAALLWPSAIGATATSAPQGHPIMLVVDVSGSMGDDDGTGKVKIDGAKLALLDFLSQVEQGVPLGLRVYPDQSSGASCNKGRLTFPVGPRDPAVMSAEIRTLQPDGDTPTAEAMRAAASDLDAYEGGTLVIVSDGESTCSDPCEAAREIAAQGFDLETITVGFKISDEGRRELRCVADALDGHYVDADDGKALGETFDEVSRPGLSIELVHPKQTVVADGVAEIDASVANVSQQEARDVVVRLRFEDGSPGVHRPVVRLGNLAPGEAPKRISWRFRPGVGLRGQTLRYTAVAKADNTRSDVQEKGEVSVVDRATANDAGPILGDHPTVAILGDSYSAGEGADDYLDGTDADDNSCHRSRRTYLVESFGIPDQNVLACSGALIAHVDGPDGKNGVDSQVDQLRSLYGGRTEQVEAVVMTVGGNDAKFGMLARSCLARLKGCDDRVYDDHPSRTWRSAGDFLDETLDATRLADQLAGAYESVHRTLNDEDAVRERGGVAPIVVLAYPLPIPLTGRACSQMWGRLSNEEMVFVGRFSMRLNGIVESAVKVAQDRQVPASFAWTTETAFLPEHTACDLDPYARSLNSFNGVEPTAEDVLNWWFGGLAGRALVTFDLLGRSLAELAHPNKAGYEAKTGAVVRWSLTEDAREAADRLASAEAADRSPPSWSSSEVDLGQLDGRKAPVLQGGTTYPLTLDGFAPHAPVEVTINSETRVLAQVDADANGRVHTTIGVPPDMPGGDHEIKAVGGARDRSERTVEIPVEVESSGGVTREQALAYAAMGSGALAALGWLLLLLLGGGRGRRRRDGLRA